MDGYKLLREYEESLAEYWNRGYGNKTILIAELQGFLDCLIVQGLIPKTEYGITIDNFRDRLKSREVI